MQLVISRHLVMECGQGGLTQRWVSKGLTPGHCFFGSSATVRENSRKILQVTERVTTPSPHVTLHSLQLPIMNLRAWRKKWTWYSRKGAILNIKVFKWNSSIRASVWSTRNLCVEVRLGTCAYTKLLVASELFSVNYSYGGQWRKIKVTEESIVNKINWYAFFFFPK